MSNLNLYEITNAFPALMENDEIFKMWNELKGVK